MTENTAGADFKNAPDRRSIEAVATTTTGFIGPCRYGPFDPQVVTSLREFESIYGDGRPLVFQLEKPGINYLWQSARAFFEQGGMRLYIARIFNVGASAGFASQEIGSGLQIRARFPGSAGNLRVRITFISQKPALLPLITISLFLHDSQSPALVWRSASFESALEMFSVTPTFSPEAPPIIILGESALLDGRKLWESILETKPALPSILLNKNSSDDERSVEFVLSGGTDGVRPRSADYSSGLKALENLSEIAIVAAPGSTANFAGNGVEATATIQALIAHAEQMRYRFAVLDSGNQQSESDILALRAKINSSFAALYYPWVRILDPVSETPIDLPPSGFVAGIYVRHDISKSVSSAPANEVVDLATGFDQTITPSQQEVLNSAGVNCFRVFPGRGNLLWGARTVSSDPEWKYVSLRRYLAYLEASIDKGTQWVVFEPNGEALWAQVRLSVGNFLTNEWKTGRLLGNKADQAYWVRCDRSTMTQNDLDNGRLVCLVGVAPLKTAEFVIFTIGQWTADKRPCFQ